MGQSHTFVDIIFVLPLFQVWQLLAAEESMQTLRAGRLLKDKDYCPIEIIKGLTDKGQFQYLTKLMGPQEGTYLYATQFHSLR